MAPKRARDKWRLEPGLRECRERFVPGAAGQLVGVAVSNRSAPHRFQQTCLEILRGGAATSET